MFNPQYVNTPLLDNRTSIEYHQAFKYRIQRTYSENQFEAVHTHIRIYTVYTHQLCMTTILWPDFHSFITQSP